jgi:hypothetical protein
LAVRRGVYQHGKSSSENHPQRLARHSLQQACAKPVERTPPPGRRLDRGAAAYGAAWDWTLQAAPTIDIEGLPLAQFLAWAARETGREIVYASPEAEAEAAGIVVHGSIAELSPTEALDAVLATTSVHAETSGGHLVVESR